MLRTQIRRNAERSARATTTVAEIERSIRALNNEDLLDLADIFANTARTPLAGMATAEMTRRNLTL